MRSRLSTTHAIALTFLTLVIRFLVRRRVQQKPKDDEPLYVVTETPLSVHEVKGVTKVSDVNFRVTILSGDGGLNLFAADAADGQGWCDALARASE